MAFPNLKVFVGAHFRPALKAKIMYSFQELFWRVGMDVLFVDSEIEAEIVYSDEVRTKKVGLPIFVSARVDLFDKNLSFELEDVSIQSLSKRIASSEIDVIGWIYRFLTLADEFLVRPTRADGNKNLASLPRWRREIAHLPIVEYMTLAFVEYLNSNGLKYNIKIGFSNYRLLLTHDTDSTNSSVPLEILYDFVKGISRFDLRYLKKMFNSVQSFNKPYHLNENFGFEHWYSVLPNYKHTFFISFRGIARSHLNDVRSSASDMKFPSSFLKLMQSKYPVEFGVHPSIRTKHDQKLYSLLKNRAENFLGLPIFGLRHHYWSLDWRNPTSSFRKMVNSGYRYDCTLAYPDTFGLRAGTCLPFRPFDEVYCRPLNIYLISTCIMDSWVLSQTTTENQKLKVMIKDIKKFCGVINLDWHTESVRGSFPYEAHFSSLKKLLLENDLRSDSSALPLDLITDWLKKVSRKTDFFWYINRGFR